MIRLKGYIILCLPSFDGERFKSRLPIRSTLATGHRLGQFELGNANIAFNHDLLDGPEQTRTRPTRAPGLPILAFFVSLTHNLRQRGADFPIKRFEALLVMTERFQVILDLLGRDVLRQHMSAAAAAEKHGLTKTRPKHVGGDLRRISSSRRRGR